MIVFSSHSGLHDTCNCAHQFKYFRMGERESSFQLCCTEKAPFSPSTSPGKCNDLKPISGIANYCGISSSKTGSMMGLSKSLICELILLFDFFSHIYLFLFTTENHHSATSGFIDVSEKHGN